MTPRPALRDAAALQSGAEIQAPWQVACWVGCTPGALWGEVYRWPLRSVACLLARLALAPGRSLGREELVELLWPGVAVDRGRARLRQTQSALRSMLEPAGLAPGSVIVADRLMVHINLSALACDAQLFERHVSLGQWLAAQALYRSEFMHSWLTGCKITTQKRLAIL